ncbi:MAG: hypothetical protein A2314_02800 [Elusimicrobia bacterium RIFOXYB2_FULL_50_12]|nr:MAG: hypothetical protein A2314_02800 [Elusimicrobia bacterium RIFOXYB2_FULL_50_12]
MIPLRIGRVVARLKTPAYLVTAASDIHYLTGFSLEGFWLLITREGGFAFASPLLAGHLRGVLDSINPNFALGSRNSSSDAGLFLPKKDSTVGNATLSLFSSKNSRPRSPRFSRPNAKVGIKVIESSNIFKAFVRFCKTNKIREVGFNPQKISFALAGKLAAKVAMRPVDNDPVEAERIIKDAGEIEKIRQSCSLAAKAYEHICKYVRPGVTEEQIGFKIEEYFAKNGAKTSFPCIVAAGPNSANPHHINSGRKIEENDVVLIDLGCILHGYCSDLTRTLFLGKINRFRARIYSIVRAAHHLAIKRLKSGVKASAIDKTARRTISACGYGRQFIHSTGHGVGIEIHESPRLGRHDNTLLKPGMVITVEPGIYLQGQFGVRIEDTLLITEKGNEVLTR